MGWEQAVFPAFTLCSYFIQKPFTQSTLFLHVFPIYFNHRQLEIAATQKRLQDFFHNTRADKKLSALLPFNNTFKKTYHPQDGTFFHGMHIHFCQKNRILPSPRRNRMTTSPTTSFMAASWSASHPHRPSFASSSDSLPNPSVSFFL